MMTADAAAPSASAAVTTDANALSGSYCSYVFAAMATASAKTICSAKPDDEAAGQRLPLFPGIFLPHPLQS